jgi:hypothetical protein
MCQSRDEIYFVIPKTTRTSFLFVDNDEIGLNTLHLDEGRNFKKKHITIYKIIYMHLCILVQHLVLLNFQL